MFKERIDELDNSYKSFKKTIQLLKMKRNQKCNPYQHHPEIFFSAKDFTNINFDKLISKGKFGKVLLHFFIKIN